jgi:hypothetical protein
MSRPVEITKPWITEHIIEKRRKYENTRNETEEVLHRKLRNQVIRESKNAIENWIESCCENIN